MWRDWFDGLYATARRTALDGLNIHPWIMASLGVSGTSTRSGPHQLLRRGVKATEAKSSISSRPIEVNVPHPSVPSTEEGQRKLPIPAFS